MAVTLRYWAAAKEAAGMAEEEFSGPGTLAELLAAAAARRPDDGRFVRVLDGCAFLVDGDPAGVRPREQVGLPAGAVVEALPPFAGG
jgi:molybdopterin converting factor small subunit